MAKTLRWIIATMLLALIGGAALALNLAAKLGAFAAIGPQPSGACRQVPNLPGAEDMAVDRRARRVWVSSDDRAKGPNGPRGAIYLMPLDGFEDAPMRIDVTLGKPANFHPHGVSLWTGADGRQVLYAVNHPGGGGPEDYASIIEIYDVDPSGLLAHRGSVKAGAYPRINDVAGAGPAAFYATVESIYPRNSILEILNMAAGQASGGLVYWRDGAFTRKAAGLDVGNSVALTPDGGTLYATATLGKELRIYDRNLTNNDLSLRETVFLGSGPDNIDIAPDGGVWIAAHPKLAALAAYAQNPKNGAPSQVLLVERDASGQGGDAHQAYLTAKGPLSAASIAIADGDRMILGSIMDSNALVCVLPKEFRKPAQHRFNSVQ